ncbi:MAG: enoyl-CoA hydratase/isomerase family protein [Rhodothermales bacterium]|nr:enoyl-CoA hydratase/isomerase family protein [Rhodothermales bacterium]MBO6781578.1 enoyl-CoA hydratase/isomerase family protein [Rhodothermales bacterium]
MIRIDHQIHPSVRTIRMDRAEKRNALDAELVEALTAAVVHADEDDAIRVIVLTGTGKAFSAGADLAALQRLASASFEDNLNDSRTLADLFESVYQSSKPVVARVNGHAIAGGCGLAAVCDFVVADDRARFGFTEVRIGFVPAIISVYLLERFPEAAVRRDFLHGGLFTAAEAAERGLVNQVVGADALDAAVASLAGDLARETSPTAVAATKLLLRQQHPDHDVRLERAVELNARARGTAECRAGVAAFLAKTPFPWADAWDSNA